MSAEKDQAPQVEVVSGGRLVAPDDYETQRYGNVGTTVPADQRNADWTYAAGDVVAYIAALGTAPPVGFEVLQKEPWNCLGWLDSSGGVFALSHTTKDIGAAGSLSAIRTVITGGTKTLQVTCLEAENPYARSLYDDVPVTALAPASRIDTASVTSGSAVVSDTSATTSDVNATVTGTGIPAGSYVTTVNNGVGFTMNQVATATNATDSLTVTQGYSKYVLPEVPADNKYALVLDSIDGNKLQRLFAPVSKVTARGNDQIQQSDAEMLQLTFTFYPTTVLGVRGELVRYVGYPPTEVPTSFVY
jgi:hypothetical protein